MAKTNQTAQRVIPFLGNGAKVALGWLASWPARLLVVTIFLGVGGWLFIGNVWDPLHTTIDLPPGVSPNDQPLNTEYLQDINTQRIDRLQNTGQGFSVEVLFKPAQ